MNTKTDTIELDIPGDDIECWVRYPKHRWVYDVSRLLDAQNVEWSIFNMVNLPDRIPTVKLMSNHTTLNRLGYIYTNISGDRLISEVYIVKGEMRHIRQLSPTTGRELDSIIGQLELRLNAFVILHFQKFTGVISVETHGNNIFSIQLRPYSDVGLIHNNELVKLIRRIYKKTDITVSGLIDRGLHETLAS